MTDQQSIEYSCPGCGFVNTWSRDEIAQRGRKRIFKTTSARREDLYTLPCKNPETPQCAEHYIVAVERVEN
jgi:hypothetical protein